MEPAGARFVLGCSTRLRHAAPWQTTTSVCATRSSPGLCTVSRPPPQLFPGNRQSHESAPGTFGRQSRQRDEISNQPWGKQRNVR